MTAVQHAVAASAAATDKPSTLRRAHFYAEAADAVGSELYNSFPHSVWVSHMMRLIQTFALPLAFWFKPVCVCVALVWLVYRAYNVLTKNVEELASLLGFDIPPTPVIDLASIKADGAIVHWSLPEKQKHKSTLKFEIHLNGNVLDAVSIHETAVTIGGLRPNTFYVVRVALVNQAEFSSKSEPVRFRTKPHSSGDFFVVSSDGHETDQDGATEVLPYVRHYRGLKDIAPPSVEAAPMTRESSAGLGPKRSITGRRPSPAVLGLDRNDSQPDESETQEGAETIQQLQERLDAIRRETDEAEKQAKEEEEEELRLKEELTKERDELKAEATDKEKASRDLKRQVNTLERQNTAAQNERSKHERLLQQKKQERQKVKDDIVKWAREAEEMKADVERIKQDRATHLEQIEREKEALRARQAEETAATRGLDDEIREKNAEIKKLDRAVKNSSPDGTEPEPSLVQQMQQDAEDDRQWHAHRMQLQQQYAIVASKLEAAKRFHAEQFRYLESVRAESIRAERRRHDEMAQYASPPPPERLPRRGDSQRSRRAPSGHSASDSPRLVNFPVSSSPFGNSLTSVAPSFPSAPFLNIHNGMTIVGPTDAVSMSEEDRDKLTGGAPMSPGAGAELLPADLFSSDGDNKNSPEHVQPLPGLGSLPGLPGLPGPIQQMVLDQPGPGPASPAEEGSRSPSVFASPQISQNNLHIGSPENIIDPDRRSIRSTRSNRAASGTGVAAGSRFSSLFGIKARTKTMSDEGPALGKAQSHSMPRQDQGLPGIDSATRKRNSSISGTGLDADLQHDGASDPVVESSSAAPRRRAFGIFTRDKGDGWPSSFTSFGRRPGSPRPGSTHSNELPRPSADGSRWGVDTWPSGDATTGARNSPLSFVGGGWPAPSTQQPRMYGSRHPSRRPSVQHGQSGLPEDIMEDSDSDVLDPDSEPHLAPIGTRPPPGSSKQTTEPDTELGSPAPKLNPAAKDFRSLFASMRSNKDKNPTASSSTTTPLANPRDLDFSNVAADDSSPPDSRKSRDARSMTTTESSLATGNNGGNGDASESGRNSLNDLVRTSSYANSDATGSTGGPSLPSSSMVNGSGGGGKESFMQKISRKSSSGKFSLPTFKREKSHHAPASHPHHVQPAPVEGFEAEGGGGGGDGMSASVGSLKEGRESTDAGKSGANRGSGRNWSSVLRMPGKKKGGGGGETPSLSGVSLASTEDDADEGEE